MTAAPWGRRWRTHHSAQWRHPQSSSTAQRTKRSSIILSSGLYLCACVLCMCLFVYCCSYSLHHVMLLSVNSIIFIICYIIFIIPFYATSYRVTLLSYYIHITIILSKSLPRWLFHSNITMTSLITYRQIDLFLKGLRAGICRMQAVLSVQPHPRTL
jgi:hypothetical protein